MRLLFRESYKKLKKIGSRYIPVFRGPARHYTYFLSGKCFYPRLKYFPNHFTI